MIAIISSFSSSILMGIIKFYQKIISPALPARCRYYPTCSEYGLTAIKWHGPSRGGLLALKRICSCHPLGGHGIDFVPLPLYKDIYYPFISSATSGPVNYRGNYQNDSSDVSRETFIVERGVYKDSSSYRARLNHSL